MQHLKTRLLAVALIIVSISLGYYNWQQLFAEQEYSIKLAAFAPVCVIGGLYLLIFPTKFGKPETTADKIIVLAVFVIGLLAGLANWYLMDPGFFGR